MVKTDNDEKEKLIDEKTENPYIKENVSSQNASKWEPVVVKSIRDTRWRWLALALISFMTFGSYFCSDSPNSIMTCFIVKWHTKLIQNTRSSTTNCTQSFLL